ncbi:Protein rds1 [Ceratobasidium theobromae]|uniref:Protein rds1 n=1 Tax=Ceratobasidium theobromae TaxID=1582974 RepID=A0A5N5QI08_9AGAM|nr:Protein rds1 [Ceratobasidium theobromae]
MKYLALLTIFTPVTFAAPVRNRSIRTPSLLIYDGPRLSTFRVRDNGGKFNSPKGGVSPPKPVYHVESDFDYQSINLALNQEWIELDLFRYGLKRFSNREFEDAGLNEDDRYLIGFMADQEVGHARALGNLLGGPPKADAASKPCKYTYPFHTVREFVDFCQKLTRWGESGVYGFLPHLDSRPSAQILLQSITTEARQQMIFRQFEGLFAMPVWFETGITQSMAWTLLAPYLESCPQENPKIKWRNFPALNVTNNPSGINTDYGPAISRNRPHLTEPGRKVTLTWEDPGKKVGPKNFDYVTATAVEGKAKYAAWVSQFNVTYTPLENIQGNSASTEQPGTLVYPDLGDPQVNGTTFIAITDTNLFVTPANLSLIDNHIVAGPAIYQAY